ncbi:MAG TPA: hypothetical protein VMK31_01470 [Sphingomicrobium sp.]|nr:hypothetical protein [Sphingomicrobium sp.]
MDSAMGLAGRLAGARVETVAFIADAYAPAAARAARVLDPM